MALLVDTLDLYSGYSLSSGSSTDTLAMGTVVNSVFSPPLSLLQIDVKSKHNWRCWSGCGYGVGREIELHT